jgi:hypothetical protein
MKNNVTVTMTTEKYDKVLEIVQRMTDYTKNVSSPYHTHGRTTIEYFTMGDYTRDSHELAQLLLDALKNASRKPTLKETNLSIRGEVWSLRMIRNGMNECVRFVWHPVSGGYQIDYSNNDGVTKQKKYHISSQVSGTSDFNGFLNWVMKECVPILQEDGWKFSY